MAARFPDGRSAVKSFVKDASEWALYPVRNSDIPMTALIDIEDEDMGVYIVFNQVLIEERELVRA